MEFKSKIFLGLFLLFLFACQGKPENTSETEENGLKENPISTKQLTELESSGKERSKLQEFGNIKIDKSRLGEDLTEINCYVKKIYRKDNFTYVDIDLVEVILTPDGKRTIINQNPKLRTYIVNDQTIIYLHNCEGTTPEELPKIDKILLEDKTIIVVGSAKNGVLESLNFGCYG